MMYVACFRSVAEEDTAEDTEAAEEATEATTIIVEAMVEKAKAAA